MATKANYLAQHANYAVYIVTTEQGSHPACYPLQEQIALVDLGINYDRSKSYWSFRNLLKAVKHVWKQYKFYQKLQPDVVISPNYNFDHYGLPFLLPKKTKLIKELHSSRFYEAAQRQKKGLKRTLFWKLQDWIEARYDAVVVLNPDEASFRPGPNVVVIPNPVDPIHETATLTAPQVMAAGRLAPVKAFEQLIHAWSGVHERFPNWALHIYGDGYGSTAEELQELITSLQLEQVVQLRPSVTNLPQTMLDYSIFALSSETECFPTVLLEALSVGVPVVSYDCPTGPRHIITHGHDGLLVQDRKPEVLAQHLLELILDANKRNTMGANAKNTSRHYYPAVVMKSWLDLFQHNP